MNKTVIAVVVIVILLIGGYYLYQGQTGQEGETATSTNIAISDEFGAY